MPAAHGVAVARGKQATRYFVVDTNDTCPEANAADGVVHADLMARYLGYPMCDTLWSSVAQHVAAALNAGTLP